MANKNIEKELTDLERTYWQAMKDQDVDTAMRLTDDPFTVAGAQGVNTMPRSTFPKMMEQEIYTLNDFELKDVKVRQLSEDVAIVSYMVREDLTVDGKPVTLDAAEASTWIRRNGGWVCTLHTESLKGDPFGRDRRPLQ